MTDWQTNTRNMIIMLELCETDFDANDDRKDRRAAPFAPVPQLALMKPCTKTSYKGEQVRCHAADTRNVNIML